MWVQHHSSQSQEHSHSFLQVLKNAKLIDGRNAQDTNEGQVDECGYGEQ